MTGCRAACPHCEVDTWWVSDDERKQHVAACWIIEKGRMVEELRDIGQAVIDRLPVVDAKPRGWKWMG